jgi:predicted nucleic acid-binding protein
VTFVDTSFWVALQFRRDGHHSEARAIWEAGPGPLVTTNHVLGETWTFLRRRTGHAAAVDFVTRAERSPALTVRRVGEAAERDAWRWLRRHGEREYSFVDATSFAVMRSLRIVESLAFDGDFTAAGFVEVRAGGRGGPAA